MTQLVEGGVPLRRISVKISLRKISFVAAGDYCSAICAERIQDKDVVGPFN